MFSDQFKIFSWLKHFILSIFLTSLARLIYSGFFFFFFQCISPSLYLSGSWQETDGTLKGFNWREFNERTVDWGTDEVKGPSRDGEAPGTSSGRKPLKLRSALLNLRSTGRRGVLWVRSDLELGRGPGLINAGPRFPPALTCLANVFFRPKRSQRRRQPG